jgi:hypothetical protein
MKQEVEAADALRETCSMITSTVRAFVQHEEVARLDQHGGRPPCQW